MKKRVGYVLFSYNSSRTRSPSAASAGGSSNIRFFGFGGSSAVLSLKTVSGSASAGWSVSPCDWLDRSPCLLSSAIWPTLSERLPSFRLFGSEPPNLISLPPAPTLMYGADISARKWGLLPEALGFMVRLVKLDIWVDTLKRALLGLEPPIAPARLIKAPIETWKNSVTRDNIHFTG